MIGDDYETVSEDGYGGGEFISVTNYLEVGDRSSAQVEEGWFNPMEYECYSVFHASPVPCETPGQLHEWLSDGWKHSTAVTGAWEKACRTYPPMCGA